MRWVGSDCKNRQTMGAWIMRRIFQPHASHRTQKGKWMAWSNTAHLCQFGSQVQKGTGAVSRPLSPQGMARHISGNRWAGSMLWFCWSAKESLRAPRAAAIAYTLVETAKMNNVDPEAWLSTSRGNGYWASPSEIENTHGKAPLLSQIPTKPIKSIALHRL